MLTRMRFLFVPLLVASLAEGGGEPLETLVQTISRGGAGGLDVLFGGREVSTVDTRAESRRLPRRLTQARWRRL